MFARQIIYLLIVSTPFAFLTAPQDKKKTTKSNTIEYRGKKLTLDKFRRAATRTNYSALASSENKKVGYAVSIEGQIEAVTETHWIILMQKSRNEQGKVKIDLANVGTTKARAGAKVKIAGIQTDGLTADSPPTVAAYLYEYVIPIEWKYQFRPVDKGVTVPDFFFVDGTVKNTGKQTITSVSFDSRLTFPREILDLTGSVTVPEIKPGETKTFSIQFSNDLRWTTIKTGPLPTCELYITDYQMAEW